EGWAHANRGVALFNMGRVAESQTALDTGLAIFQDVGHRPGVMAVYRFLALARPEDPRAADWLEEALRDAEEKGDRNAQLSSLVSLAWHHFFRFRLGGPDRLDVIADLARQTAELGQELGADELAGFRAHGGGYGPATTRPRFASPGWPARPPRWPTPTLRSRPRPRWRPKPTWWRATTTRPGACSSRSACPRGWPACSCCGPGPS